MKKCILASLLFLFVACGNNESKNSDYSTMASPITGNKRTVTVTTLGELQNLQMDEIYVLSNGTYNSSASFTNIVINSDGVTIRAQEPGKAIIGNKVRFFINAKNVTLFGLVFSGEAYEQQVVYFQKGAQNSVISHCHFYKYNPLNKYTKNSWILMQGFKNRVEHCTFEGKESMGPLIQVTKGEGGTSPDGPQGRHVIAHNNFINHKLLEMNQNENGLETITIGYGDTFTGSYPIINTIWRSYVTVENNIFVNCNSEGELISVKSSHNVIRNNLIYNSKGHISLRGGKYNIVDGNIMIGLNHLGRQGVRICSGPAIVINNYFEGLKGNDGWSAIQITTGNNNPSDPDYKVDGAFIANNVVYDTADNGASPILIGSDVSSNELPENVFLAKNVVYSKHNSAVSYRLYNYQIEPVVTYAQNIMYSENNSVIDPPPSQLPNGISTTNPSFTYRLISKAKGSIGMFMLSDFDAQYYNNSYLNVANIKNVTSFLSYISQSSDELYNVYNSIRGELGFNYTTIMSMTSNGFIQNNGASLPVIISDSLLLFTLTKYKKEFYNSTGTVGAGAVCSADAYCIGELICKNNTCSTTVEENNSCGRDEECSGSLICASDPLNSDNKICMQPFSKSVDDMPCERDIECGIETSTGRQMACYEGRECSPLLGATSFCSRDQECLSGICTNGLCVESKSKDVGAQCFTDTECKAGLSCNQGVCATKLSTGSICHRDENCADGLICGVNISNSSQKVCMAPGSKVNRGDDCQRDVECGTHSGTGNQMVCYEDDKCYTKVGTGSWCSRDKECLSGLCSNFACVEENSKVINDSCYRDRECGEGLICFEGLKCYTKVGVNSWCSRDEECTTGACYNNQCK